MTDEVFYVVSFDSTHHAIKGEKILLDMGLKVRTIPTPREISASCGLSIKFSGDILNEIKSGIENNSLLINGVYKIIREEGTKRALKV